MRPLLSLVPFVALACASGKDDPAPEGWPEGLEPVIDCAVDAPGSEELGDTPELLNLESEEGEPGWVCAHAWIQAPVADVWAAFQDDDVVVDRRAVAEWTIAREDDPAFDVGFVIHNVVHDVVTVEFDITWNEGVVVGTAADPEHVAITFEKTDGTPFIHLLDGSVQLYAFDEATTELILAERLHGATGGIEDAVGYITDLYADALASAHGEALPTYD
ncbi:MAG: hypothetical protein H6739_34825 [Alphaproteobacteria bacterium]|nr:hypothetical protein [Alphaproteobacteria bacterium]